MSDTRESMRDVARAIETVLPPHTGFVLLAFDLKPGGRIDYVSNSDRAGVRATLQQFLEKMTADKFAKHIEEGREYEMDARLIDMKLWAWVGEDELGSGQFGLKQAIVPAGCVPMVACVPGKIDQEYIRKQLQAQARQNRVTISRVCFTFECVEEQLK